VPPRRLWRGSVRLVCRGQYPQAKATLTEIAKIWGEAGRARLGDRRQVFVNACALNLGNPDAIVTFT
jgi:hypothetical protein